MRTFTALPPLSLYIHLPWCEKKCPYCDFNSHTRHHTQYQATADKHLPEKDYVEALLADLAQDLPQVWGRKIDTVFIGGGTPSLFSAQAIDDLLAGVRALTNLHPGIEVTMEANPGSAEREKFTDFRAAGINRLSIGVQSFNDEHLQALGRVHDAAQAVYAAEAAHAAGFASFNIDLMFGLPKQSAQQALADIEQAIALSPQHISYYQLTLEPNTLFYQRPPTLPNEDASWAIQQSAQQSLERTGFGQYEISAYAQPNYRCKHNLNYWQFGDYLGIGAGAHGKISNPASGAITRTIKRRQPDDYMQQAHTAARLLNERTLSLDETCIEFMMNAMRLKQGVPAHLFLSHTGLPLARFQHVLETAQKQGLLHWDHQLLCPSDKGFLFLNDLLSILMDEPAPT